MATNEEKDVCQSLQRLTPSRHVRAEEQQQLVTHDEAEEINAEVREDVAHLPVGVHGAADDLGRNSRQQQSRGQHRRLALLLHLKDQMREEPYTASRAKTAYREPNCSLH